MLAAGQKKGFLGRGPVEPHLERALDLSPAIAGSPSRALDLGTGGGVPGLALALAFPETAWSLLEGSTTRSSFLAWAVDLLGLADRVSVVAERAETAGRGMLRATMDLVVARSFASPPVTAECGAPFLRPGGQLIVAEPPGGQPARWIPAGLALLGLRLGQTQTEPTAVQVLVQTTPCPDQYPRRTGIPAKRPLF